MISKNLWPSFNEVPLVRTPKVILIEQAAYLEKISHHFIKSEVISSQAQTNTTRVSHLLKFSVARVENYSSFIVAVEHDFIKFYPATIASRVKPMPAVMTANNDEEFMEILSKIFAEKETQETLINLLIQSKAIAEQEKKH